MNGCLGAPPPLTGIYAARFSHHAFVFPMMKYILRRVYAFEPESMWVAYPGLAVWEMPLYSRLTLHTSIGKEM